MASQGDSNSIKFVNVASLFSVLKGSPLIQACMRLEATVNDKKKIYIDKVSALMSVLENVLTDYLNQSTPEQTLLLFDFLHRHTLNLVLHGDWGKNKGASLHMTIIFKRFETVAVGKNLPTIAASIRFLLGLLAEPWGNPILTKILQEEQCSDEEVMSIIKAEMGLVLIVRLEIMAEARCDDQALRLIQVCLRCVEHPDHQQYFQPYAEEIVYIRDIYLLLLVRSRDSAKILTEVTKMGLVEGLKLVRRCTTGNRMTRLRKSRLKMVDVVANKVLVSAMIQPVTEEVALRDMIEEWYNFYPDTQVLFRHLRNMILNAVSSQHIYILGQLLVTKYGEVQKSLCIELYIRALTVNLNEMEKYKSNCDQDKVKECEIRLSNGFLLLAEYLKEDIITCRECVLTAFSLNPTIICYNKLKDLAVASGKLIPQVIDAHDNCENNQSSINCEKPTRDNQDPGVKLDTGQPMGTEHLSPAQQTVQLVQTDKDKNTENVDSSNVELSEEKVTHSRYDLLTSSIHISDAQKIGIPQTLCDDLSTVISSARYQVLNWHLDWTELSSRCESYIMSGKEVRSTEKELKYLNIDYNQFKDWPREGEYDTGIEKGFESCVEIETDEGFDTSPGLRLGMQSNDEGTQDSVEYSIKFQTNTKEACPATSSGSEYESKGFKGNKKSKRKTLPSISDSDTGTQDSRHDSFDNGNIFIGKLDCGKKKAKIVSVDRKNNSVGLIPKKCNVPLPLLSQFSQPESLDLVSIEEDAKLSSPFNIESHHPPHLNNIRIVSPTLEQVASTASRAEKPNLCIAGNDLFLTTSLSPFSSSSKYSNPSVLKSLRMYRAKKPATDEFSKLPGGGYDNQNNKFTPMLSTIHLHPRILSKTKPKKNIGVDEPEIIDLVDDDEDDSKPTITRPIATYSNKIIPFDVTSQMKVNFTQDSSRSLLKSKLHVKDNNPMNNVARNLGLKSLDMIRPATSATTVQVVQLPSSVRPLVSSNSNTGSIPQQSTSMTMSQISNNNLAPSTVIYTVPQQSTSVSLGQASNSNFIPVSTVLYTMPQQSAGQLSNSNLASNTPVMYTMPQQPATVSLAQVSNSNITTVIYTMPQQTSSVSLGQVSGSDLTTTTTGVQTIAQQTASASLAQVSNNNMAPISTVIYTMPIQTASSHAQVRSTTNSENKSTSTSSSSFTNRFASATDVQNIVTNVASSQSFTMGSSLRSFFSAPPRQVFPQALKLNSDQLMINSPESSSTSSTTYRNRSSTPQDGVTAKKDNSTLGLVRVERISFERVSSESNQPIPNLAPIKTPACTRPHISCVSRQVYTRSGVPKTSTVTATYTGGGRSMPVTAHIQRVGYPRETSPTQGCAGIQLKYIFKEGSVCSTDEKQSQSEPDADCPNVSMVLSAEQIQQLLPKSTAALRDKSTSDHEESGSSQGSSLPKFQQAFGRTMYQSNSTPSGSSSLTPKSESSQSNFNEQLQPSSTSADSRTSTSVCTVLSKAVQTTSKDSEMSNKSANHSSKKNEHSSHHKTSHSRSTKTCEVQTVAVSTTATSSTTTTTTTSSQIETQLACNLTSSNKTKSSDRSATLQQTPVKIFCKVPVTIANTNLLQGKSVAILKTSVSSEKLTQTQVKYEVDRTKETVIRSNMSTLLTAALQAQPHLRQGSPGSSTSGLFTQTQLKSSTEADKKKPDHTHSSGKSSAPKNYRKLPVVQHQQVSCYTKPNQQVSASGSNQNSVSSAPLVTIPIRTVLTTGQHTNNSSQISADRMDVSSEALASPSTSDDPSGSSLLDQQLKEFESVFNKVKKTSQMKERTNSNTAQIQSHLNVGQQILLTQNSSSASVEFTNTSTNQTALFQSTSTNTIHDLQGERVSLTFISQPSSGATNSLIAGTGQKITSSTPVVVVQSCSKPVTSPALSVTSQSSLSPAPPSTPGSSSGKITASIVVKQNKLNKTKTISKPTPTTPIKVSTLPKPQQKPQEDEQTTQRIYAILDKYAEQLRNSPELKNKPAPRRRSNPPTNPSQNSKRKKSSHSKTKLPSQQASCSSSGMEMSPAGSEDLRTIGSEDSSNGVSQLSQTLNSPQSRQDDPSTPTGGDVSSETSESLDSRDTRVQSRVVLTETTSGQNRTVIMQDNVPTQVLNVDASKLLSGKPVVIGSQTIVPQLVLPNVAGAQKMQIFPVPADGRPLVVTKVPKMYRVHQVTMPRGTAPLLGPGAVVLRQMCGTPSVKQVKLPTGSNISTQSISSVIPSGSHSFTLAHDATLESGDAININLDSAILLNSTSPPSISFVHRSIPSSSYQNQNSPSGSSATTVSASASVQKTTLAYSTSDLNVNYIKQDSGNTLTVPINVIPVSSSQDSKSLSRTTSSSSLTCITLDDDLEYTTDHGASEVPTLVISHNSSEDKRWRSGESSKSLTQDSIKIKKNDVSQNFTSFQSSVKTIGYRSSTPSSLFSKRDRFIDNKKVPNKTAVLETNHELEMKDDDMPEHVLQDPELCDEETVSSDSASSGRVKSRSKGKGNLLPETTTSWPYGVTKIECIVKADAEDTCMKPTETENHSLSLTNPQETDYKKKANNVENTIYQMAFKRSDRTKITNKETNRNVNALERDLRLQKSLSEECEDLGVDEPSTSDLFPEAELLMDPDHSSHDSQELPIESFSQTLNSSSSSDSIILSQMFPVVKRSATYRNAQKSPAVPSKSNKFISVFNPIFQFTEESTSAPLSGNRADSPDCQVIEFCVKDNKTGSSSESDPPYTIKSQSTKGSVSPSTSPILGRDQVKWSSSPSPLVLRDQTKWNPSPVTSSLLGRDQTKWNASPLTSPLLGRNQTKWTASPSTSPILGRDQTKWRSCGVKPLNGGGSTSSSNREEMRNISTSEETHCTPKSTDDNCKDTEIDTATDSDSNIDSISGALSLSSSTESKSSFVPIPNPAANTPFTYGGNRSNLKLSNRKTPAKHEIWKNILKQCDIKDDLDSDMSDMDQMRTSDKRSTSTDDDLQSEGDTPAKNGLGTESEETQSTSDRIMRSMKKLRKRSGSPIKYTPKSKVARRAEVHSVDELLSELPMSLEVCKNTTSHANLHHHHSIYDTSSRRSSLRGHSKINCPCCNGSQENPKSPNKTSPKTEKYLNVPSPSSSTLVVATSKKKPHNKTIAKSSHITKKR